MTMQTDRPSPRVVEPHLFPTPKMFSVKTDWDEASGEYCETIIWAFNCTAVEVVADGSPLTVIRADHVQVAVPGSLWSTDELPGKRGIA